MQRDENTPTVSIMASELDTNDIFPSYDGWRHEVAGVASEEGDEVVQVNVRKSNGETYSVDFKSDAIVNVLAY